MRSSHALIIAPAQDEEPEGFWAKVKATAGRVPMVETALAAWYCAIDEATPPHVKAVIFGALAYFVAPIDLIPDILAGIGFTDDAAVLAAVVSTVQKHMRPEHAEKARDWLGKGTKPPTA